ncbi:hypothetical protein ACEWY4_018938 [Coilia grayii]|uniref:CYRIA/CYRIB Rac1 binding domain-containing protein n=1 Tax=Coilia grayii TaxID=363190 RepID=A0ABD1JEM1_9TELE
MDLREWHVCPSPATQLLCNFSPNLHQGAPYDHRMQPAIQPVGRASWCKVLAGWCLPRQSQPCAGSAPPLRGPPPGEGKGRRGRAAIVTRVTAGSSINPRSRQRALFLQRVVSCGEGQSDSHPPLRHLLHPYAETKARSLLCFPAAFTLIHLPHLPPASFDRRRSLPTFDVEAFTRLPYQWIPRALPYPPISHKDQMGHEDSFKPSSYRLRFSCFSRYLDMGNLLKVLTCTDLEQEPNFFLDFENAQPTEAEREVWEQVDVAIQNPNDESLQEKAWAAVVPLVGRLKKFYEFSQRLEAALHSLLWALTSETYDDPTQHLEREQALAKQFAEILHFTLRFDELKMTNPAIQNDFSYYRRTLNRMRINNVPAEGENEVNNELANRISLFYADATPMLKTLSDGTTKFVSENKNLPIENTTDVLSTMASVCKVMLETPEYRSRFTSEDTVSFCLRVMVGVIILYDYVHPVGAFAKSSKIDMKGCIKVLRDQPPNSVEGLLNALRYTTKHLNDESTNKAIKAMLQ